jgi:drug/metabolite transporter (DMT)-like permease
VAPEANRSAAEARSDAAHESAAHADAARGRWLVFGATLFWGTSATLARFVFRDRHVPALTAVELRLLISVALLGPWLAWRRPAALRVSRADWGYFLVLGLFGVAAVQGTYYYAISVLGVGLAILIQYLAPALIVSYDALRGARVRPVTVVALASALIGIAMLVGNLDPATLRARPIHARPLDWAVGFGAAVSFAFYVVFSKRGLRRYAPETVLFYTFLVAGLMWAVVTPPWRIVSAGYGADLWMMFAALGVFSTLVPFILFNAGLRRLSAAQTGIIATLEPVVAVLSAAAFLGEGLRAFQWLGALLVLVGASLASTQAPEAVPALPERG